jgi:hypothetical protein
VDNRRGTQSCQVAGLRGRLLNGPGSPAELTLSDQHRSDLTRRTVRRGNRGGPPAELAMIAELGPAKPGDRPGSAWADACYEDRPRMPAVRGNGSRRYEHPALNRPDRQHRLGGLGGRPRRQHPPAHHNGYSNPAGALLRRRWPGVSAAAQLPKARPPHAGPQPFDGRSRSFIRPEHRYRGLPHPLLRRLSSPEPPRRNWPVYLPGPERIRPGRRRRISTRPRGHRP